MTAPSLAGVGARWLLWPLSAAIEHASPLNGCIRHSGDPVLKGWAGPGAVKRYGRIPSSLHQGGPVPALSSAMALSRASVRPPDRIALTHVATNFVVENQN